MAIARQLCVIIALLGMQNAIAQPLQRSLSLNPYAAFIENATRDFGYNTTVGAQGAIVMPDPGVSGLSQFRFGFTVPTDYAAGTDMLLIVAWRSDAISCVIDLRNSALYRSRPGAATDSGSLAKQSTMLAPNSLVQTEETVFDFGGLELEPGDAVQAGLYRSATLDSCDDDLHILGLSILYEPLPDEIFADGFED